MTAPSFIELNKQINKLLRGGYYGNAASLVVKTKSTSGLKFEASGSNVIEDSGKTNAALITRYQTEDGAVSFVEKWSSDNVISSDISFKDHLKGDVSVTLSACLAPNTGRHNLGMRSFYQKNDVTGDIGLKFDPNGAMLNGSIVYKFGSWLLGYRYNFGMTRMAFSGNALALGYDAHDFTIRASLENADFVTSIVHRVNDNLTNGVNVRWSSCSDHPLLTFGTSYQFDPALTCKAKIDNELKLGLALLHNLRPGVQLGISSTMDADRLFTGGKTRFGASLSFES